MTSRGQGAPYFRIYGLELVSKPAISLKKSRGGATAARLKCNHFLFFKKPRFFLSGVLTSILMENVKKILKNYGFLDKYRDS